MKCFMTLKGKELNNLGLSMYGLKRKPFESENSYRRRIISFKNNLGKKDRGVN